jgi:hypothetical protein
VVRSAAERGSGGTHGIEARGSRHLERHRGRERLGHDLARPVEREGSTGLLANLECGLEGDGTPERHGPGAGTATGQESRDDPALREPTGAALRRRDRDALRPGASGLNFQVIRD